MGSAGVWINLGFFVLLIGLPLLIVHMRWSLRFKTALAIVLPWFLSVVYTLCVREHDNNHVASVMVAGWVWPALTIAIYSWWRRRGGF